MQADADELAKREAGSEDDNHAQDTSPIAEFPAAVNLNVMLPYFKDNNDEELCNGFPEGLTKEAQPKARKRGAGIALSGLRPPGVPVSIEGEDLAAIPGDKCLIHGIDQDAPDGGILHVGVFFFQQQKVQPDGGKKRREIVFQLLAQPLAFPVIQGMFQQHHPQIQVAFRGAMDIFSREEAGPQFFLGAQKIGQSDTIG